MSFELTYKKDGIVYTRTVYPKGRFSIVTTRQNHRYKEELSGEMVFIGDDFDWIMDAGPCTEIQITCEFKRTWSGLFSHSDCSSINRSKKKLEVVPRTNDEYDKIEPWMRLEMNIIPAYKRINSRIPVYTYNQYEVEERIIRINEPYTGLFSENWVGYSVNDWIGYNGVQPELNAYSGDKGNKNSLIGKLIGLAYHFSPIGDEDAFNRVAWLDLRGYELHNSGLDLDGTDGLRNSYWRESMFTLSEVINYYTKEDLVWEYCDVIYKREVFKGQYVIGPSGFVIQTPPPSGLNFDPSVLNSETYSNNVCTGRWIWNVAEKKWIRRYLGLHQRGTQVSFVSDPLNLETGDGFDYSPLIDSFQDNRLVKKQVLFRNKYEEESHGHTWYGILYGFTFFDKIFHKPEIIIQKFIQFVKDEGATTDLTPDDFESRYLTEFTNPYDGFQSFWAYFLLAQNSDIKRPLDTEKATKEMISFQDFLEIICRLTNSEWAIIDGKFIIEHISYFDRGLTYDPFAKSSEVQILNPYSIENVAKNKGFMQLTDIYHYDRPNMPKFEIYQTAGGEEPKNNNTRIEYSGGCINNKPNENIDEIVIDTTTDYHFTQSEGNDEGITFIRTVRTLSTVPGYDYMNYFIPSVDEYGRYVYNENFTLEKIIERYHNWGRNDTQATLNKKEWLPLQPFKNVIQSVSFPYKVASPEKMENPYTLVVTGLGYGIIKRSEYITKTSWVNYELGLWPIANIIPPDEKIDWHVHDQIVESDTWLIKHDMITNFMMRPVIFDTDGNEIDYNSFRTLNVHEVEIKFTSAVNGQAHLISLDLPTEKRHIAGFFGSSNELITHNLNQGVEGLALSPVFDFMGNEIEPDSIEYVTDNAIRVKFTSAISGYMAIGDITGGYVSVYSETPVVATDFVALTKTANRVYGKPVVLMAGEEILYNSQQLLTTLRRIGFSEEIIATIVVMEKTKD